MLRPLSAPTNPLTSGPGSRACGIVRLVCLWLLFLWAALPAQAQEALEVYELNYSRGAMAFGLGHYEQAEKLFRAALEAKPDDPEANAYLGQTLLRRRRYPEAETVFRRMLELDSASGPAWLGLGVVQYNQQQYAEAKASLLAAEKAAPDDALVHLFLGLVHHELGEFEAAPDRFQRAATLSPDLAPTAQYYSGVAHFRRGAFTEAKQTLEAAIAAAPEADYAAAAKDLLAQAPAETPKAEPTTPPSPWKVTAVGGMEYDTNVVLLPGGTSPPAGATGISGQSDYRTVLSGSVDYRALQLDRFAGGMSYAIYQSFHSKLSGFDVEDHAPSAYVQYQDGPVSLNLQYIYNYTLVGRSPYLNANTALSTLAVAESETTTTLLQFRYMDKVFRDGRFLLNSSRNGKNWLVGLTQYVALGEKGRAWLGYIFDTDVTGGGSPKVAGAPNQLDNADWAYQGHHITTGVELPPVYTVAVSLAFDWIHQQYLNPNSYAVDPTTRRRDNIYSFTGAASRDLNDHLSLTFQYTYSRDDTNVDVFTYTRSIYSLMLNASF